jgi:cytoskeleton-associated protein 5
MPYLQAELARWVGPELVKAALFEKMREASRKDVEKLLEDAPTGKPTAQLYTRKEQAKRLEEEAAAGQEGDAEPGAAAGAAAEEEEEVVGHIC